MVKKKTKTTKKKTLVFSWYQQAGFNFMLYRK